MQHWADYVIFAAFLLVSMGIGLFHALTGGRQRTTDEFILADRKLKVLPTTISMLVSFQSAIMILGGTAEVYTGGVQAWIWSMISFTLSLVIVQAIYVPWLFPWKLTSVYKYFQLRYGTNDVRVFAAILGIISNVMYMGTAMLAPSVALETATGFPMIASIPIMAAVCTIYTSLGGMKAVIWTDVFQFVVMVAGMLAVLIKGYIVVNGFSSAIDLLNSEGRLVWADVSADPRERHTVWGFLIGYTAMWNTIYGNGQASVQRFSAVESMQKARWTLLLNIPCVCVMATLSQLIGVTVVAYFIRQQCDPLTSGQLHQSNELLPQFVKEQFQNNPGFSGLFLATLYSGALSSVSSSLSGSAANAWDDIIKPNIRPVSELTGALISKALVVFFGFLAIGISSMAATLKGPITQVSLAIGSSVNSPLCGMFLVSGISGFFWVNSKGVLCGGIIGFALSTWLIMGSSFLRAKEPPLPHLSLANCTGDLNFTEKVYQPMTGIDNFYSISYMWFVVFGGLATIIACLVMSAIFYKFGHKEQRAYSVPDSIFIRPFSRKSDYGSAATNDDTSKHDQLNTFPDDKITYM